MILIIFEALLRFLLLWVVLLVRPIRILGMPILVLLIFVKLLVLPSRISCSVLLPISLLMLNLDLIIELLKLILVGHIVSLVQVLINFIRLVLGCSCGDIWISRLLASMIQWVLLPILRIWILLLFKWLLGLLVEIVVLILDFLRLIEITLSTIGGTLIYGLAFLRKSGIIRLAHL